MVFVWLALLVATSFLVSEWRRRCFWQKQYADLQRKYLEQGEWHHRFLMAILEDPTQSERNLDD